MNNKYSNFFLVLICKMNWRISAILSAIYTVALSINVLWWEEKWNTNLQVNKTIIETWLFSEHMEYGFSDQLSRQEEISINYSFIFLEGWGHLTSLYQFLSPVCGVYIHIYLISDICTHTNKTKNKTETIPL